MSTKRAAFLKSFSVILILLFISISCKRNNSEFINYTKTALRQIGNELLLANQDSTSIILPIKQITNTKFSIVFQKKLEIEPDTLAAIFKRNLVKEKVYQNYSVQVLQRSTKEVSYSFEIRTDKEKKLIPCKGRLMPLDNYKIHVTFIDEEQFATNYKIYLVLIFLSFLVLLLFFRKNTKPLSKNFEIENHLEIGSFRFYPHQNKLVKKAEEINLSKKECELLEILVQQKNQIVKREDLMKKVWEDNGVIVGRSLDTYISKLRKKIKSDTNLKLINIHGVGYKLEVNQ